MTILIPRFRLAVSLGRRGLLWQRLRTSWLEPYIQHDAQLPLAAQLDRLFHGDDLGRFIGAGVLGRSMRGAGYAWESIRWLDPVPGGTQPVVTTGANSLLFNVLGFISVIEIGFVWQVAGTVTALVADFDSYPQPNGVGTVVDKLDGTNGVITAPTVASQAIGNVLFKDLSSGLGAQQGGAASPGIDPIDLAKGSSVKFNVTTTTTAGSGVPYILVVPRAETNPNGLPTIGFSSS